jgi:hypothetical protein
MSNFRMNSFVSRRAAWALGVSGMIAAAALPTFAASAPQTPAEGGQLTAKVSRWQGDTAQKRKGPAGFDVQFRLVGARFDGTFGVEGFPQTVPEGEAFDAQVKLTNVGAKKISLAAVSVTGNGVSLATNLLVKKVEPRTSVTVASFKVPPQSSTGSSLLITVILKNGDKHAATLTFSRPS